MRLRAIADRFLEKQEFVALHQGALVGWSGLVESVSQHAESKSLLMVITTQGMNPEVSVFVSLPESLRTKAFSLQKGDFVTVKGRLSLSTPNFPDIDAQELIVVKPRNGG